MSGTRSRRVFQDNDNLSTPHPIPHPQWPRGRETRVSMDRPGSKHNGAVFSLKESSLTLVQGSQAERALSRRAQNMEVRNWLGGGTGWGWGPEGNCRIPV